MRTEKRIFGDFGESAVCKFLMKHGFSIIERNYLKPWGEIDIVARKGEVTHFIEVKSVQCSSLEDVIHETGYRPEDNIHEAKLKRLSRTIQTYVLEKNIGDAWQFDIATAYVERSLKRIKIRLMSNVVLS